MHSVLMHTKSLKVIKKVRVLAIEIHPASTIVIRFYTYFQYWHDMKEYYIYLNKLFFLCVCDGMGVF